MRKLVMGLFASLIIGAMTLAAPPVVSLPKEVSAKAGRLLVIEPKGTADYKSAKWEVKYGVGEDGKLVKPSAVDLEAVCDGKKAYFATTIPGEYVITVTVWNTEGIASAEVIVTVAGAPAPNPNPGPKPNPDPTPVPPGPVAKNIYIAVIKDPMNVSPALANIIGDTKFWDDLTIGGSDWDVFKQDSDTAITKGYIKEAQKVQTAGSAWAPTMIILNKDNGKVLKTVKLPLTKEEIKSAVLEVKK